MKAIAPHAFADVAKYESDFGLTIHLTDSVIRLATMDAPYNTDPFWVEVANSKSFDLDVITENWMLPQGAFGESCGPT